MGFEGIGARVLRKEDERHLRGRGRFVADIVMPDMKEVAFLRSPLAHARIRGIAKPDCGEVLVAADFSGLKPIVTRSTIPGYKISSYPAIAER
jgi:aerobic carbon-monoxide dehydrogenase large subunit